MPEWLGGTRGHMAPEQEKGLAAVQRGQPLTSPVDARADIYSLGVLLDRMLAWQSTQEVRNLDLGVGLADILRKCQADAPRERYASAADLATDLRLHLANQPLRHTGNRSWLERWWKWRRRRPHGLALVVLLAAVLVSSGAVPALLLQQTRHIRLAEQTQAAQELHALVDQVRFLSSDDFLSPRPARTLEAQCRALWERRAQIGERLSNDLDSAARDQLQADLLDLAILGADLRVRLASPADAPAAHRDARQVLQQAETLLGSSAVLRQEQRYHAAALGLRDTEAGVTDPTPRTSWEHCAVGRVLLRSGRLDEAATSLGRAQELEPGGLWPNYYLGQCAYRRKRHPEALMAFSACVALAPEAARVYFNRALVLTALGCPDQAQRDYDRALKRDAGLAPAALNRGLLRYQAGRLTEAMADLGRALELGHDPDTVHYNLALVHLARHDPEAARVSLDCALKANPRHPQARQLRENWQRQP